MKKSLAPKRPRPVVRVKCGLSANNDSHEVEGSIEVTVVAKGIAFDATVDMRLHIPGGPVMYVYSQEDRHAMSPRVCIEDLPADEQTLDGLIALFSEVRAAMARERPAMLAKSRAFARMLKEFEEQTVEVPLESSRLALA